MEYLACARHQSENRLSGWQTSQLFIAEGSIIASIAEPSLSHPILPGCVPHGAQTSAKYQIELFDAIKILFRFSERGSPEFVNLIV
jgi:hypothetical protein